MVRDMRIYLSGCSIQIEGRGYGGVGKKKGVGERGQRRSSWCYKCTWSRAQCKGVLWMGHRVEVSIVNRRWEWQRHRRTADTCHRVNPRPHRT